MPTSESELKKIATLACIKMDTDSSTQLGHDVGAIMDFVEQLRMVNTTDIAPLFHPLDLHQRLRADVANEENSVSQLASTAPLFAENLYLVPKVIDIGK